MHKIISTELIAKDDETNNYVKSIKTTNGEFESRQSTYTQTIEEYERITKNYMNVNFNGPPICTHAIYYPPNPPLPSNWVGIKELSNSRLCKNGYSNLIYDSQVKRVKNISSNNEKTIFYFLSLSKKEWAEVTREDIISFTLLQADAGVPHVSLPMGPFQTSKDVFSIINKINGDLRNKQTLNLTFHPETIRKEAKVVIEKIAHDNDYPIISVYGRSASPVKHSLLYSYFFRKVPSYKLTMAVDVAPKLSTGLSLQIALRQFNFDLTSRSVWFPRGRQSYQIINRGPDQLLMYNDHVAGMLNNEDTIMWEGCSIHDKLLKRFPGKTGLSYEQLMKVYNFISLNLAGKKEAQKIKENKHVQYIEEKIYLQTFWNEKARHLAMT